MNDQRFTDNSAGTRMALDVADFLTAVADQPEQVQRTYVLDQHAKGAYGWMAARELEQAGWLPGGSAATIAKRIQTMGDE